MKRVIKKPLGDGFYLIIVKCVDGSIKRFTIKNEYIHPYICWENLAYYDEYWEESEKYLYDALGEKRKLCVSIMTKDKEYVMDKLKEYNPIPIDKNEDLYMLIACREGCLADYFDVDEIIDWYENHGICGIRKLRQYFNINMHDLMAGKYSECGVVFNFIVPFKDNEFVRHYGKTGFIVIGLLLGYPLEATCELIKCMDSLFTN